MDPVANADARINRFVNVNPQNVPVAVGRAVTQAEDSDDEDDDDSGTGRRTSQRNSRRRNSPMTRSNSKRSDEMDDKEIDVPRSQLKKIPTTFESGEGRVILGNILGFIRGQGWEKIHNQKGSWFVNNVDALFDHTKHGILSE